MWGARGARLWRHLDRVHRFTASFKQPSFRALSSQQQAGSFVARDGSLGSKPSGCNHHAFSESFLEGSSLRHYSQSAAAELEGDGNEIEQLLPKEEEKPEEVIRAIPRTGSGKIVSKKARRVGQAPSIVFSQENGHLGGDKQLISVESKQIERMVKRLGRSFFMSKTFDLEIHDEEGNVVSKERVLPRSIHMYAGSDRVLNVTFIRAPATALLKVDVPLIFIGEDACPGIRKGGYVYTMMRTVKYRCPGDSIPSAIEVDLSTLDMGEKILLRDLKVAPGITLVKKDSSLPVCKVMGSRASTAAAAEAAAAAS